MIAVILYLIFIYGLMALFTRPGKDGWKNKKRREEKRRNSIWT